ncbi:MAG: hypothetical protein QF921_05985 [Pseudomonadales bacterium]|nr:hypothetical protein [Pseudomonadales bacterium]MDP6470054.1 hypothetical protein [Pseudomonadales bacterium]MDP6826957.1 hypothetical protein [Pseudomonadales bacterium]MDP6971052.1 hypothetical protein [Pseudomonadales bacterium]
MKCLLLRLPGEVNPLFEDWLHTHFLMKRERVMNAMQDMHQGKPYRSEWGLRARGSGPLAELLHARFQRSLNKHRLQDEELPELRTDLFSPPVRGIPGQMSLF